MAFHCGKQNHEPLFFRDFIQRSIQLPLKLGAIVMMMCSVARIFEYPLRFSRLTAFVCAETIQRQSKTDSNNPCTKAIAFPQPVEPAVCAEQRFLGDVFRTGVIPQNSPSDPVSQRGVLQKERLPFAGTSGNGF